MVLISKKGCLVLLSLFFVIPQTSRFISIHVSLSPSQEEITWEGWGCSLAWWAQSFGNDESLANLLFTRNDSVLFLGNELPGLGFNIVRYLAGATSTNIVDGKRIQRTNDAMKEYRFLETFWKSPEDWDFTRDENQRIALLLAKDRGANLFELFANSPPWWMLNNYNPSGAGAVDNLNVEHHDNFAYYLSSIVHHAKNHLEINFSSISPFNEPSKDWWKPEDATQEGCFFSHQTQQKVILHLLSHMQRMSLCGHCKIASSDDWGFSDAVETIRYFDNETLSAIGQWNVHGYEHDGPRYLVNEVARHTEKKLWNSEYGDDDISGRQMGWTIFMDFRGLKPSAWCYWQPVDAIGGWGLVKPEEEAFLDGKLNQNTTYITPKFYVLAHFTRHLLPGMKILRTENDDFSLSAYDEKQKKLVVIAMNNNKNGIQQVQYDISHFSKVDGPITGWRSRFSADVSSLNYQKNLDILAEGRSFWIMFGFDTIQSFEIEGVWE